MNKLAILPNAPSTREGLDQFQDMFADLMREVGRERFANAVDRCCRREHSRDVEGRTMAFYPQFDELKAMVPPIGTGTANPNCPDCHGTTWKRIDPNNKFSRVTRCHCYHVEQTA